MPRDPLTFRPGGRRSCRGERMDIGNYLQKSIQILQLDADAIRDVSKDEDALLPALIFFAVSGLAIGAGRYSFETLIFGPILLTLLSFVIVGLLNILARLFGGSASFLELYRPLGLAPDRNPRRVHREWAAVKAVADPHSTGASCAVWPVTGPCAR